MCPRSCPLRVFLDKHRVLIIRKREEEEEDGGGGSRGVWIQRLISHGSPSANAGCASPPLRRGISAVNKSRLLSHRNASCYGEGGPGAGRKTRDGARPRGFPVSHYTPNNALNHTPPSPPTTGGLLGGECCGLGFLVYSKLYNGQWSIRMRPLA